MSDAYLLDTVAAIGLLNGTEAVNRLIEAADEIFLPIVMIGELYFGAENSGRVTTNLEKVDLLTKRYAVLYCDLETAQEYGRIELMCQRKGNKIPQNDMWIAAIARQHDLAILTRDKHFAVIDGLTVQGW